MNSLPGCFALHKPIAPNNCNTCPVRGSCFSVVLKSELKPILKKLTEIKAMLENGKGATSQ